MDSEAVEVVRGYTMDMETYLKRLRRIEGQVRGLQRLIDEDTYCIDVLTQVSAVTKALQSVAIGLVGVTARRHNRPSPSGIRLASTNKRRGSGRGRNFSSHCRKPVHAET